MAELLLRLRDRELKRVPILSARMSVGRDAASDLMIDNAGVSRTHALVLYVDDAYRVQDAESQNGITVNGKRVQEASLTYGDIIGIGKFEIELLKSAHAPQNVELAKPSGARNVMRTLQMDAASSARMQEEVLAKLAAQRGAAAPQPRAAGKSQPPATSRRAPSPPPPAANSDLGATLKLAGLVLLGVVAFGSLAVLLFSR